MTISCLSAVLLT